VLEPAVIAKKFESHNNCSLAKKVGDDG
jgi:hypothetical protein